MRDFLHASRRCDFPSKLGNQKPETPKMGCSLRVAPFFPNQQQSHQQKWCNVWRIMAVSKWLITMLSSPITEVIPFPMAYRWGWSWTILRIPEMILPVWTHPILLGGKIFLFRKAPPRRLLAPLTLLPQEVPVVNWGGLFCCQFWTATWPKNFPQQKPTTHQASKR